MREDPASGKTRPSKERRLLSFKNRRRHPRRRQPSRRREAWVQGSPRREGALPARPGAFFAGFACAVIAGTVFSYEAGALICALIAFAIGAYDYHSSLNKKETETVKKEKAGKGESGQWW